MNQPNDTSSPSGTRDAEAAQELRDVAGGASLVSDPRRLQRGFLLISLVGVGVVLVWTIRIFLQPILLAAIVATLFYPVHSWIAQRLGGRQVVASLLTCLLLVLGVLGPLYTVGHMVVLEAKEVGPQIKVWWDRIQQEEAWGLGGWVDTASGWIDRIPLVNQVDLGTIEWGQALQRVGEGIGQLATTVLERTSRGAANFLMATFVALFTLFYFFLDGPRMTAWMRQLVPLDPSYKQAIAERFVSVSRALFKGTLTIALIQGTVGGLTLWVFGVQGAVLWGMIVAILSIVPAIGPWLVMYPAAAVLLLTGQPWKALGVFLVTVVVILQLDNLLRPRLVGQGARMHDLMIFFSTLGGIVTFGAMGFIIGPVVAALFLTLAEIYEQEFCSELGSPGSVVMGNEPPAEGGQEAGEAIE